MSSKEKKEDETPLSVKDALNLKAEREERYFGNSVEETIEMEDEEDRKEYKFKMSHLLLLARTNKGYQNLIKIASESQLRGFYYKPRVDKETLKKYSEGIIATSACRAGEIPRLILRGRVDLAKELAIEYSTIFDSFYLEIQPSENVDQLIINETLEEISKEVGIPLMVSSDAHYIREEDSDKHEILLAVSTGAKMNDEDRFRFDEHINYIMTEEELLSYEIPQEAIDNTKVIADQCNVELDMDNVYLPDMPKPIGYTPRQFIEKLCLDGLYQRYNSWDVERQENTDLSKYVERIKYELDVIENKGFIDYFLIVMDFVNYAKSNDILIGPGRGSAAGCMVSYTLGITNLDPIKYDLIFERFLNPSRNALPDIDIDVEEYIEVPELFDSGRQRVIEYITSKYGKNRIAQILAMGTIAARSALKDVGRALDIDHLEINKITKFVPNDAGNQWSLKDCVYGDEKHSREPVPEILDYQQKHERLFDAAIDFEGIPRHTSIHAAGIIIAPVDVSELIPLCRGGDDAVVSQFDKDLVEEIGLIKMDLLGLRTLGVIHKCVNLIEENHGVTIDLDNIDLEDPAAMKIIKEGDTDGIFQIESNGMKSIFRQMNEVDFEAIIVALSLNV
jgi:DNA polymerase-3 subunit alpha